MLQICCEIRNSYFHNETTKEGKMYSQRLRSKNILIFVICERVLITVPEFNSA